MARFPQFGLDSVGGVSRITFVIGVGEQDFFSIHADGETYIDGARIPGGKRELRSGDVVQLGEARMEFRLRFPPDVPQVIAIPVDETRTDSFSRRKKGFSGGAQCMDMY